MDRNDRLLWIDVTRIVAIFGVVTLHVAAPHLYQFGRTAPSDWHTANIIDSFTRPSVPLFFMVSGALLMDRPIGFLQLKSRLIRLMLPLVAWSLIYLAIRASINPDINWIRMALGAFIAPLSYHLWFLYALIGLYLCLPLVGPAIRSASPRQLYYGLGLWVIASGVIPALESVAGLKSPIELSTVAGFMGYMVLGHVLAKSPRPDQKFTLAAVLLIIVGYAATVFGTAFITVQQGIFFEWFYGYLSPNVMLFSAGAFVLLRVAFEGRKHILISKFSDLSFGIYLCHVAVLMVAETTLEARGWWIIPYAVMIFMISATGVFFLRRIGAGRLLAP